MISIEEKSSKGEMGREKSDEDKWKKVGGRKEGRKEGSNKCVRGMKVKLKNVRREGE